MVAESRILSSFSKPNLFVPTQLLTLQDAKVRAPSYAQGQEMVLFSAHLSALCHTGCAVEYEDEMTKNDSKLSSCPPFSSLSFSASIASTSSRLSVTWLAFWSKAPYRR